jgi:hypothetical protein
LEGLEEQNKVLQTYYFPGFVERFFKQSLGHRAVWTFFSAGLLIVAKIGMAQLHLSDQ